MPAYEEKGLPGLDRTILIVEDNDVNRELLGALLQDEYRIISARDGQEGLELMQEYCEELSLVLLDIFMPVMDGFEFLRRRNEDGRLGAIPVIVTTASELHGDEIECLKLGANDFVRKPYDPDVILNRVHNTIRLRETASIVNQLRWDETTGLYRKEFFFRRADNLLAAYPDRAFDLVCSDIRNFKMLNERYGHERCDRLLRDLADRLSAVIPGISTSGRIDGDSFGFLIEHQDVDWTPVLDAAVNDVAISHLYVRFGIVQNVEHGIPAGRSCDRAILALEQLQDSSGAGVAWYDDALRQRRAFEHAILDRVADSIDRRQFSAYYQPKHDVRTGKVAGAEALARWYHPDLGLVQPSLFISVFEKHGQITKLDRYMCDEVCREIARLKEKGLPMVPISINFSPLDFDDRSLPEYLASTADRHGVDRSLLHVELTESAYAEDPENVVNALNELRANGFKVELDDFGAGYSSLALLGTLPIDILKIDGDMVRQASKADDFRIIKSAIQIARALGLETVIEGVETGEALERLATMGCDLIQGFYFSWPLREDDFERYLDENR